MPGGCKMDRRPRPRRGQIPGGAWCLQIPVLNSGRETNSGLGQSAEFDGSFASLPQALNYREIYLLFICRSSRVRGAPTRIRGAGDSLSRVGPECASSQPVDLAGAVYAQQRCLPPINGATAA